MTIVSAFALTNHLNLLGSHQLRSLGSFHRYRTTGIAFASFNSVGQDTQRERFLIQLHTLRLVAYRSTDPQESIYYPA